MRISDWSSDVCSSDLPTAEADGGSIADLLGAAGARTYQTVGGAARDFAQNTYDFSADILNPPAYLYEAMVGAEEPLYRTGGLALPDRKSVVWGKSVSARVAIGGWRVLHTKTIEHKKDKY